MKLLEQLCHDVGAHLITTAKDLSVAVETFHPFFDRAFELTSQISLLVRNQDWREIEHVLQCLKDHYRNTRVEDMAAMAIKRQIEIALVTVRGKCANL